MNESLKNFIESKTFERFILTMIVINAITLGIEASPKLGEGVHSLLHTVDKVFLGIFTVELFLRGVVYKKHFFKDPWRIFDFIVVSISLLPASGPFSVVRALRVLRTLRMVSVVPSLRKVVNGLLSAIPGLTSVGAIMLLIFYVGAVITTKLFGSNFPEWFGNIGASAYSLFQIMTLESWSMGIVRPVMREFPFAWVFFLPFILVATFMMLNLFIAVIVNAMQSETDKAAQERAEQGHDERVVMLEEIRRLRATVDLLVSRTGA